MPLTYCPNCRSPISKDTIGWLCWNAYRANSPFSVKEDDAASQQDAKDIYGTTQVSAASAYQANLDLCETYNPPGSSKCTNSGCGAAHDQNIAQPCCPTPHCRAILPDLDQVSPSTLTVSGPSGCGKTHYIIALADWWNHELGNFDLTIFPAMSDGVEKHFKAFRDAIRRGAAAPATPKDQFITFSWTISPPPSAEVPDILVSFPDVNGEGVLTRQSLARNRHYHHTSGIIFILDGERIASAQDLIEETDGRDPMDHVTAAQAMIQDLKSRLSPAEFRNMPIAVCVNKIDMLSRLDSSWDHAIATDPRHNKGFDFNGCNQRNFEIQRMLLGHRSTANVTTLLNNTFENVMFFGMATLGCEVVPGQPIQWRPQSVEDPFLWLLWHLGYVNHC